MTDPRAAMRHTDREYEQELQQLRDAVLLMGARVEQMTSGALSAFERLDIELAKATIGLDEEIDRLEMDIDERCVRVLARRQPVASDLRFITTTLKIVTDLERVGDLAVNLCERVLELDSETLKPVRVSLVQMGDVVSDMLHEALDAFIQADAARAERVILRDNVVDATYAKIFPELLGYMIQDTKSVAVAQKLQSIAKYLERMADHATNLGEMVVYMVRGEDKRHANKLGRT
ncbi:MAG TPA: phosphate signaling complex protein PhoU [Polyangiaceae bacterium]|nr:phosphate signaling complex protein PhoU [Polyangiaceae bacterium]